MVSRRRACDLVPARSAWHRRRGDVFEIARPLWHDVEPFVRAGGPHPAPALKRAGDLERSGADVGVKPIRPTRGRMHDARELRLGEGYRRGSRGPVRGRPRRAASWWPANAHRDEMGASSHAVSPINCFRPHHVRDVTCPCRPVAFIGPKGPRAVRAAPRRAQRFASIKKESVRAALLQIAEIGVACVKTTWRLISAGFTSLFTVP